MRTGIYIVMILCLLAGGTAIATGGNDGSRKGGNCDTLQALVLNSNSAILNSIKELSGAEILTMIDSLLDEKAIPVELIREINDYAESRLLEHDYYVSLTAFYDTSRFPASSIYGTWNTRELHDWAVDLETEDSSSLLILEDKDKNCDFVMPVCGKLTSNFGWRDGRNHNGIDIDLQVWDKVQASFAGMVRIAKSHGGYGRVVVIRHYNGLETLYAHLHRIKVKPGDIVEAGEVIGLGGSSGNSTGSHLHYEMRYRGKALNPLSMVDIRNESLYNDTIVLKRTRHSYSAIPYGTRFHTISRGDFLYGIAEKYGVSVTQICEWNGIRRNSVLKVGRRLRISI